MNSVSIRMACLLLWHTRIAISERCVVTTQRDGTMYLSPISYNNDIFDVDCSPSENNAKYNTTVTVDGKEISEIDTIIMDISYM